MRVALGFVGALGLAAPAFAYVVAPVSIVRQFAQVEALDRVTPGPLVGRARVGGSTTDLTARLELSKTSCKSQVDLPGEKAVSTFAGGHVETEGTALPALEAFTALACPLLTLHDIPADEAEKAVQVFAKSIGVDYAVSSLSQLDGRVGLVVGARAHQLQRPQIWFDKVTSRPSRVIASHGGKLWDIRFLDGASIATNRQAPRVTAVWQGTEKHLEVHWMAVNPKAPAEAVPTTEMDEEGDD